MPLESLLRDSGSFQRRINLSPDNNTAVVQACCVLHNFLTKVKKELPLIHQQLNPDGIPYLTNDGALIDVRNLHEYHTPAEARGVRNIHKAFFNHPAGAVTWQGCAIVSPCINTYLYIVIRLVVHHIETDVIPSVEQWHRRNFLESRSKWCIYIDIGISWISTKS